MKLITYKITCIYVRINSKADHANAGFNEEKQYSQKLFLNCRCVMYIVLQAPSHTFDVNYAMYLFP